MLILGHLSEWTANDFPRPSSKQSKSDGVIIANVPFLRYYNGQRLSLDTKAQALRLYGQKENMSVLPLLIYDFHVTRDPVISKMTSWDPANVKVLNLSNTVSSLYIDELWASYKESL